jgi:hypothetical protein
MFGDRFITAYAIIIFASAFIMDMIGVTRPEIYYSVYLVEFLVLLEVVGSYSRSMIASLKPVTVAFVLGFLYIIISEIILILMPFG